MAQMTAESTPKWFSSCLMENCNDVKKHQKVVEKSAKISASGQTCGQVRKMGLFNPERREEQAHYVYCENARFHEDLKDK